ncbi:dihydrofolate reductase family protein [Kribbella sp. NBC_00709]|uniref:dihydrofolate reductase family protein n=1 Tax=Kribbella sp. NBC_00709 TaxID=2975972 RepID=UPI002E27DF73|nr:dihydrofolate reductase family protein [Kribbella sp. NBC_00709]
MSASLTFDIFSSFDGYGSPSGSYGGYWGKQGPEFLEHRFAQFGEEQRLVLGGNTFRLFAAMLASVPEGAEAGDPWVGRMRNLPTTVVSNTLQGPLDWPDATVLSGDPVKAVARLKEESDLPLRSHGSLTLNRALLSAGLIDRVQVTIFPVINNRGQGVDDRIFEGTGDFDLELIESHTFDGHIQQVTYRPTPHS